MNIAIVGATGVVGRTILSVLYERGLLWGNDIFLYASKKSAGEKIVVGDKEYEVAELSIKNLKKHYDLALFSAGKDVAFAWAPTFVKLGAYVIDNSSAFRRRRGVPLVVPEMNFNDIKRYSKIIANPNCSTIGVCLPLNEISKKYKIKRIIVSTYQAVSGAGKLAIDDLKNGTTNKLPHMIKNNLIPQIDSALKNGYTYEEDKMNYEIKKILHNKELKISATCVRVPVENCHSESVYVELNKRPNINILKECFNKKGMVLIDDLGRGKYPMPIISNGKDEVFIGRLRKDTSTQYGVSFFICFDNIRKGASLNAVQIAEMVIKKYLTKKTKCWNYLPNF